jgi:hypothetical protein
MRKPWEDEPGQEAFRCGDVIGAVLRKRAGYLCGYVILPEDHDLYGVEFFDVQEGFHPHGGWTFSSAAAIGGKRVWVLGFDAAHGSDYIPSLELPADLPDEVREVIERFASIKPGPENYRNFDYMREQAQRAALSLARLDSSAEIEVISTKLVILDIMSGSHGSLRSGIPLLS